MANVLSLHQRQVFLETGTAAAYAKLYVYESGTSTQVPLYSSDAITTQLPQPVEADANGVFAPVYLDAPDALRILVTDEDDVALPGYPMDNILPLATSGTGAQAVAFSPSEDIPETNVQSAIEHVASLFTDQTALASRALTPWVTGGTGDAFTISPTPAITAYGGNVFIIRPDRANSTTTPTININGLGSRPLRNASASLTATGLDIGELQPGREAMIYEDGTTAWLTLGRNFPVSDTNGNGRWTKYPGGMLVCTKTLTGKGPSSTAIGNIFRSDAIDLGTWAATFSETPERFYSVNGSATAWLAGRNGPTTSSAGQVFIYSAVTLANTDFSIQVTGIGRWF